MNLVLICTISFESYVVLFSFLALEALEKGVKYVPSQQPKRQNDDVVLVFLLLALNIFQSFLLVLLLLILRKQMLVGLWRIEMKITINKKVRTIEKIFVLDHPCKTSLLKFRSKTSENFKVKLKKYRALTLTIEP